MEPITLRLSPDLISELDAEAADAGFSSRSEYVRQLLRNRSQIRTQPPSEYESNTLKYGDLGDLQTTVGAVETGLAELEKRVRALEKDSSNQNQSSTDASGGSESRQSIPLESFEDSGSGEPVEVGRNDTAEVFVQLERWLWENGPDSEAARAVLVEAARLLDEQGPLEAEAARSELWERFPDSYGTAQTLWASTVERLYEETPGFERPERGVYAFDRDAI